jgi:hypothetical protein
MQLLNMHLIPISQSNINFHREIKENAKFAKEHNLHSFSLSYEVHNDHD